MRALINNSDKFGVMANVLCMAHCLATPLLFISQAHNSTLAHEIPFLWQLMNYFFLLISFIAVYFSIKKSTKIFVKIFLMIFWLSLSFLIINEGLEGFHIPELFTYLSATSLSFLHIYNLKYCSCEDEECCVQKN